MRKIDLRLIIPRNMIFCACPNCKQVATLERAKSSSKRKKFFLTLFRFKRYHCKSCKWDGYIFLYAFPRNIKRIILNYLIIFAITVASIFIMNLLLRYFF